MIRGNGPGAAISLTARTVILSVTGLLLLTGLLIGGIFLLAEKTDSEASPQGSDFDPFAGPESTAIMPTIPASPSPENQADDRVEITHVVRPGDTFSGIAALYEVDVAVIEEANGTSASLLQPNQSLIIPLTAEHQRVYHIVQFGQTLSSIATLYGIPPLLIEAANGITNPDSITAGKRLLIIGRPSDPEIIIPEDALISEIKRELGTIPEHSDWPRSILTGNLDENYPLTISEEGFIFHLQPGTIGETEAGLLASNLKEIITAAASFLNVAVPPPFDIYIASTLYAHPSPHLRGLTDVANQRIFLLFDGTAAESERTYFFSARIVRYLTLLNWGEPSSALYSEGLAQVVARQIAGQANQYPEQQACADLQAAGILPALRDLRDVPLSFSSLIMSHPGYLASGCFTQYLIDRFGLPAFRDIYQGKNLLTITGLSFSELEDDFLESLPSAAMNNLEEIAAAYRSYEEAAINSFLGYDDTEPAYLAYFSLDRARTALWQNDLVTFNLWLTRFTELTGFSQ